MTVSCRAERPVYEITKCNAHEYFKNLITSYLSKNLKKNINNLYGSGHWDRTLICCRESGHAPSSGELHKIHRPTWPGNEWPYCPSRKFDSKGCAGHSSFRPGNRPPKDGARWPPNTGPSKNNAVKAIQKSKIDIKSQFRDLLLLYLSSVIHCTKHFRRLRMTFETFQQGVEIFNFVSRISTGHH